MAQRISEVLVEVTGAGVEMRLEDGSELAALIELAQTLGTLQDLLGVMGIVGKQHVTVIVDLEVEAALNTVVCAHAVAQFLSRAAIELGKRHGSHAILYINRYGLAELHIRDVLHG